MAEPTKQQKITEALKQFPEGASPKTIAYTAGLNHNTVKKYLPYMSNVRKLGRGWYLGIKGGDTPLFNCASEFHTWNFHNLILSSKTPTYNPQVTNFTRKVGLLTLTLRQSNTGNYSFRVATDYPLNISSLSLCASYFLHYLPKSSTMSDIQVRTIEFNKDYTNLRLDGINSISMDNLIEQFKIYQKSRGLRLEHKTKIPLSANDVVEILKTNPNSLELNIKLNAQSTTLKRLTQATERNAQLITELIKGLRK